ncbi:unnamed protein product [Meloidogyne enterolobii]|uniref:Uncharacterized protein n=1 Tax=Meloidogyne enterolobii TaxID=390850 RepID=A0ACB0ZC47_MELEN
MNFKTFLLFPIFCCSFLHSFLESSACFGGGIGGCGINPWGGFGSFGCGWGGGGGGGGMFGGSDWNFGIGGYPAYSAPIIGAYPYSTNFATGLYAAPPMPIIAPCCPFSGLFGFKKRRKRNILKGKTLQLIINNGTQNYLNIQKF